MALYELPIRPEVEQPVLVMALEGWIDAGFGAAAASAALVGAIPNEVVATFDSDELIDHRARRPMMHIFDGVNTGLTWPEIQLRCGKDRTGNDVLLLVGPEPDMRWHAFTAAVVALAQELNVRLVVGLGAFPAPVPHTRPVRLASTASSNELATRIGFVPGSLDVPSGIQGALERGFAQADIPAVTLWARVPHYVSAMPYPAASAALLDGLASLAGLEIDSRDLHGAAEMTHTRIDELIANSDEHGDMVRQLEHQSDVETTPSAMDMNSLPSGDEIAAELERFLRGER